MISPGLADLFRGQKVRLSRAEPEPAARAWARWQRDAFSMRLLNDTPPVMYSQKTIHGFLEAGPAQSAPLEFVFHILALADERLVGHITLEDISWQHGDLWLVVLIGDRQDWNRGYGTDALGLVLRYAFDELDMHRVSLDVYDFNPRAIHTYKKLGFRHEGIERAPLSRAGRRYDLHVMGLLRSEWAR